MFAMTVGLPPPGSYSDLLRGKTSTDCRGDADHIGGHIKNSLNFPSRSLDATMATLLRKLEDKEVVVFHCALSQERGPRAARKYIQEKGEQGGASSAAAASAETTSKAASGDSTAQQAGTATKTKQTVYVLDRGFAGWQRVYGRDKDLTEGYRPEIWEDY
jgi:rhodanese-related sulfurtransferase